MRLTATEFRRTLFPVLERALKGEDIEVTYRGVTLKIVAPRAGSKLARAKRQHALQCDPRSIIGSDAALLRQMESEWNKDWDEL